LLIAHDVKRHGAAGTTATGPAADDRSRALSGAAGSYGTAFWWSAGNTALAIGPCIVLMRAERAARARTGEAAERAAAGALAT
jgi:hypothetical protein